MKTRFTPLVKMKKDLMDKRESELQKANAALQKAHSALEQAYRELQTAHIPSAGNIQEFQMAQSIIASQRRVIEQKHEWVDFSAAQQAEAQRNFKEATIAFEKFKYLEAEEIKTAVLKQKKEEQLQMDEVAMQTFGRTGGYA